MGRESLTLKDGLRVKAHAKVNLGLSVLGRRGDGFHELDTLMARISLHDALTFTKTAAGVRLEILGADLAIPPEDNLVYRAAEAYLSKLSRVGGVKIELEKRLPVAAGLGGGSSDAGATLRALSHLYPSGVALTTLAAQLGSDVAFFAADLSAARATGRGELLTPLELPELHLVLANPGAQVSAREAYRYAEGFSSGPLELKDLVVRLGCGDPDYPNDLEAGVVAHYPVVGEVLGVLQRAGLRGVRMSGSGSTCFGLAESAEDAQKVSAALAKTHPTWWVPAAQTC